MFSGNLSLFFNHYSMDIFRKLLLIFTISFSFHAVAQEVAPQKGEKLSRLLEPVNSSYHEEAPFLSPDGRTLFFSRSRHPQNVGGLKDPGDVWISRLNEQGNWTEPEPLQSVNDKNYNAVVGLDPQGNLYVLSYNDDRRRYAKTTALNRFSKEGDSWGNAQAIEIPSFLNRSETQSMSLTADGRVLLMSIDSYGSYGNEDLYVAFRQPDGSWSAARNLGSDINTYYQEMTPFLAADNQTLYFASNGLGGEGSRDLFVSKRLDDSWRNWSQPVNLGELVNTPGVELFYSVALRGDYDLYVSTQNSEGYGDIHIVESREDIEELPVTSGDTAEQELPTAISPIQTPSDTLTAETEEDRVKFTGRITDKSSGKMIGAADLIYSSEQIDSITESIAINGEYETVVESGKNYTVTVKAKGYMPVKRTLEVEQFEDTILVQNFALTPLKVGTTIQLESVRFKKGTAEMFEDSHEEIDRVVELMEENPEMTIELSGHTDNRGFARQNVELSEERVKTVRKYMIDKGISRRRIKGKGYGASKPIASNLNEEGRRKNRRVEFKVLKIK